jgi:hypothetical protein
MIEHLQDGSNLVSPNNSLLTLDLHHRHGRRVLGDESDLSSGGEPGKLPHQKHSREPTPESLHDESHPNSELDLHGFSFDSVSFA